MKLRSIQSTCSILHESRLFRRSLGRSKTQVLARRFLAVLAITAVLLSGCPSRSPTKSDTTKVAPVADADVRDEQLDAPNNETANPPEIEPESSIDSIKSVERDVAAEAAAEKQRQLLSGEWTTRRLIGLASTGPAFIDFSVSIDGVSLESAAENSLSTIAEKLLGDIEATNPKWELVLALPLVRSGWLGNLLADGEEQEQLIAMYDTNKDGEANIDEMLPFLSRGLSRAAPLLISDGGTESPVGPTNTPWGIADLDNDNALDAEELAQLAESIKRLDVNGDGTITQQEVAERSASQAEGMMRRASMLQSNSLVIVGSEERDPKNLEAAKSRRKIVSNLLRHYTVLETITRDQWSAWNDAMWNQFDANQDQVLDSREAESMITLEPLASIYIRLPEIDSATPIDNKMENAATMGEAAVVENAALSSEAVKNSPARENKLAVLFNGKEGVFSNAHPTGGRLAVNGFSVRLQVNDGFNEATRLQFRRQIEVSLSNLQLRSAITQQFGLGETAFELVDSNGDQKLSDAEFEQVWGWFTLRQGTRLVARWTVANDPWFQLGDRNGDGRLSELEVSQMQDALKELDRDQDGLLTPYEQPLLVNLEITRSDPRIPAALGGANGGETPSQPGPAWFTAMDANGDGVLNRQEFLGARLDFERLDQDKDGFVALGEVYLAP